MRIGTRGSPLALAQARDVRDRLAVAHGLSRDEISITVIKTSGDRILDRPLAEIGGKGLFTKEIEEALIAREIDLAVHSMKDMQTDLPPGLTLAASLPREDVRDAFISLKYATLNGVPSGAVIGTSSLRRQAQILHLRPDLKIVGFRGNVQTRLEKLQDGIADATLLAVAGLKRLGLADRITSPISVAEMLPAVAQGAIGIEIRDGDMATRALIAPLNDEATLSAVTAERAFLRRLEGSCRTPIAGFAEIRAGVMTFRGQVLSPDGRTSYRAERRGTPEQAVELGLGAADEIIAKADPRVLAHSAG